MRREIAVIGIGVNGLTCAHELAQEHDVTVIHDKPLFGTTSAVATAIWHVYLVDPDDEKNLNWSAVTLERLMELSEDPATSVELCTGIELYRRGEAERPSWADIAQNFELLPEDELQQYEGCAWGYRIAAPTANMARYLPWLHQACVVAGVNFQERHVDVLDELLAEYDMVVNCAGLGARHLTDDGGLFAIKGEYYVFKTAPGAPTAYIGDDQNEDGMAYLIPRDGQILVGGTEEEGVETLEPTADRNAMIAKAAEFIDFDLNSLEQVDIAVGLRPCRRNKHVRFGTDVDQPRIIHNYGHGGSGFSLAWGCAEDVVKIVNKTAVIEAEQVG